MELYPAVDVQGGRVVRLRQGAADDATAYADAPVAVAQGFARDGARWVHFVDLDRAFGDYNEAIRLQSTNSGFYRDRAVAELYSDRAGAAANDLVTAIKLRPSYHYFVMWLHIARTRVGQSDPKELADVAGALDRSKWPWPVIGLFLGSTSPEDVRASAQSAGSPGAQRDQLCEADFYLGFYQQQKGAQGEARPLFQSAVDSCQKSFVEYRAARLELAHP